MWWVSLESYPNSLYLFLKSMMTKPRPPSLHVPFLHYSENSQPAPCGWTLEADVRLTVSPPQPTSLPLSFPPSTIATSISAQTHILPRLHSKRPWLSLTWLFHLPLFFPTLLSLHCRCHSVSVIIYSKKYSFSHHTVTYCLKIWQLAQQMTAV